jgi:hypothetical protein
MHSSVEQLQHSSVEQLQQLQQVLCCQGANRRASMPPLFGKERKAAAEAGGEGGGVTLWGGSLDLLLRRAAY